MIWRQIGVLIPLALLASVLAGVEPGPAGEHHLPDEKTGAGQPDKDTTAGQQQSSTERKADDELAAAVLQGKWKQVGDEARKLLATEPKAELALFLADVAVAITRDFSPERTSLTQYDFPYSDREAAQRLSTWIDQLVTAEENVPVMILRATMAVKADSDSEKALALFEQARRLAPEDEFILDNVANGYGARNRTTEAKGILDQMLKANPQSSRALNGLGMLAMSRRDMGEAERLFKKAVTMRGAGPMEWSNLGSLHYAQKQLAEARVALEKAVSLSPSLIDARFNLAGTYHALGRRSDCKDQLRRIVKIAPTSATGRRAKKNLRALGG